MRNKNHNKRINHNNGLKIAIMLAMTSGIYGGSRDGSPAPSCEIENQGIPLNTSIQATPPTTPRALAESVYGNLAEFDRDVRGRLDNPGDGLDNPGDGLDNPGDGRNTQPPQSTPQPRPEIWVTHPASRTGLLPPLNKQPNDSNTSPNSQDGPGRSLVHNLDLIEKMAHQLLNLQNRGGASSSHQGSASGSGGGARGLYHAPRPDDLAEGGPTTPSPRSAITVSQAPNGRSINLRGRQGSQSSEEMIEVINGSVQTSHRSPRPVISRESTELREEQGGGDTAGVGISSSQDLPLPIVLSEVPVTGLPRSFASDDQGLPSRDEAAVPEPVKTPEQTSRAVQDQTPSTPSCPRVVPGERGSDSEEDDTESSVSDLDFHPNALLKEAEDYLAKLGIQEYAEKYEGIPILDKLMEIILKGDFQAEYQKCLPEAKMTPEQLVAKIVGLNSNITGVYSKRELEDKAFDVDYIIEVGSTEAIKLHHRTHLQNGEEYLSIIRDILHELNAPIIEYINAVLPPLKISIDNPVKITKTDDLRKIKEQLTTLQGSLEDAQKSYKKDLKALKELIKVYKACKSTMGKFTAKTPHQSDEALKNFKLMQDYLDKINNLQKKGIEKDAAIEEIKAEINEAEMQIASLQDEIDGLEGTVTEEIEKTKSYEGEMRVIYAGIQDLIAQHEADLVLAQEVYGSK
jgi:hypothetical protein